MNIVGRLSLPALSLVLACTTPAAAGREIPAESGWSGQVSIGLGGGQAETNMIDGIGPTEVGDDRIRGLDEDPGSESFGFPVLRFDVAYTFAEAGTQLYARNQPSRHIFLDLEVHAGVRQKLEGVGVVDVSLATSAPVTKVWKDPYLTDANRGDTERSVSGLNMRWYKILETPLSVEISSTEIEIDDEESGSSLLLSPGDQRLLRRTGQVYRYHADYAWSLDDRNVIVPAISYLDYDLDGEAMAEEGVALQLSHQYIGAKWNFTSRIYYRDLEASEDNPIYGDAADRQVFGAALSASYPEPFGWKNWQANAGVSWYESDSDVDFYDETLGLIMVGASYRLK